jgi:hypothetical protein
MSSMLERSAVPQRSTKERSRAANPFRADSLMLIRRIITGFPDLLNAAAAKA